MVLPRERRLHAVGARLLVATHFETFRSKLPDYHEFFSFKTVVYLWVALGVVKVIHEFGHGLSCKAFGGEVHEMGVLLLCLSPALYCNVSDAWTLPNKWHRIIISAAGIYVELIIAAIATFVWWNTPTHPFINNMSLSLMVVCSVSTVVFNANPLMRYDGYYVLADWLEIPNLRDRSNRFLKNLVLEHCLGIEVQPEAVHGPVAADAVRVLRRRQLRLPLGGDVRASCGSSTIVPQAVQAGGRSARCWPFASLGSMVGWPLYRLGKNLHRRGRLPDMKRWRVVVTTCVVLRRWSCSSASCRSRSAGSARTASSRRSRMPRRKCSSAIPACSTNCWSLPASTSTRATSWPCSAVRSWTAIWATRPRR